MRNNIKIRYLGWGFVAAVALNCLGALLFGSPIYALFSSMFASHLPFFIYPFRTAFAGKSFSRCVILGWESFFLCQLIYFFVSMGLDNRYPNQEGWGEFNAGGAMTAAIFFGWIPGIVISAIAFFCKKIADRILPNPTDDSFMATSQKDENPLVHYETGKVVFRRNEHEGSDASGKIEHREAYGLDSTLLKAASMNMTERIIVGVFLAGICPLLVFVASWWTAAIVSMNVPGISEHAIALVALSGLTAGIVLDLLFLPMWIRRFYTAGRRWMWAFYAALFLLAGAMFMGVPVGTFGLGLLTGVYAGRRYHHAGSGATAAGHDLRRVSFFAALLTAVTALPISILGLKEQLVVDLVRKIPGIEPSILQGASGAGVVCLFCVVLFAALYGGSLAAGRWAYRMGTDRMMPKTTP